MMVPYTSIERDLDNMFGQEVRLEEFKGQCFTDKGIFYALGSPYVNLKMCFFSSSREHVKLMQIRQWVGNGQKGKGMVYLGNWLSEL